MKPHKEHLIILVFSLLNCTVFSVLSQICHSRTGEINPVKVSNLVKLYVQRYKYFRKHGRRMDEEERDDREPGALHSSA